MEYNNYDNLIFEGELLNGVKKGTFYDFQVINSNLK